MEKEKEAISEMISVDKSDTHVDGDLQLSFLCSAQNLNFSLCIQSMSCPICVCISSSTPNCNTIALHSNKLHIQFFKRYLILYISIPVWSYLSLFLKPTTFISSLLLFSKTIFPLFSFSQT